VAEGKEGAKTRYLAAGDLVHVLINEDNKFGKILNFRRMAHD